MGTDIQLGKLRKGVDGPSESGSSARDERHREQGHEPGHVQVETGPQGQPSAGEPVRQLGVDLVDRLGVAGIRGSRLNAGTQHRRAQYRGLGLALSQERTSAHRGGRRVQTDRCEQYHDGQDSDDSQRRPPRQHPRGARSRSDQRRAVNTTDTALCARNAAATVTSTDARSATTYPWRYASQPRPAAARGTPTRRQVDSESRPDHARPDRPATRSRMSLGLRVTLSRDPVPDLRPCCL